MANNNHFTLTLDTLAPSGSISGERYYKQNGTVNITTGDASFMKVWFNENATGTKSDAGYTGGTWEAAAGTHSTAFTTDGDYYYHVVLMDDVGNESAVYNTTVITFDTTLPVVNSASINDGAAKTKSRTVTFKCTFEDPLKTGATAGNSGVVSGVITCANLVGSPIAMNLTSEEIAAGAASRSVTFTNETPDGEYTIKVNVTDAAGNTSADTASSADSIVLDTTQATAVLELKTAADKTVTLPAYVNATAFTGCIDVDGAQSDVVGYKIWGDVQNATTEPTDFTAVAVGTDPIYIEGLNFTTGDGTKNVHIRIIDDAGNIWPNADLTPASETWPAAASKSRVYDATAPSVSIAIKAGSCYNNRFISKITGKNSVVIVPTVDASVSGMASWSLKVNGTQVRNGSTTIDTEITLTDVDSFTENAVSTVTLTVVDNATNTTTSTGVEVVLDTKKPGMAFGTTLATWYNAYFDISLTGADADATTTNGSGINFVKVWGDSSQTAGTVPSGAAAITWTGSPMDISKSNIAWDLIQGQNYLHVYTEDNVGNNQTITYAQAYDFTNQEASGTITSFGYDTVAPENGSITLPDYTNTPTISASISSSDATSGVSFMQISGDITNGTAAGEWEAYAATRSITLTNGDGIKTVYVQFKDLAGNISAAKVSDTTELDTQAPTVSLQLYNADGYPTTKTVVPARTNLDAFVAQLYDMDDNDASTSELHLKYKLYGDFATSSGQTTGTPEPDAWTDVVLDPSTAYMSITGLYFTTDTSTTGEGTEKTVYTKVMDRSGNISTVASQTRIYDSKEPDVTVSNIDYNRISKVHSLRRDSEGEIENKYNDQTNFTFTPDSFIQAYKVCAYANQDTAKVGSHADAAIPTTAGSVNMSATGLSSKSAVNALVNGTDYETALKAVAVDFSAEASYKLSAIVKQSSKIYTCIKAHSGAWAAEDFVEGVDGAHIITVYVQDLAGSWSKAAEFEA